MKETDADTIPAHTLAVLVQGGNANRIAGMVFHGMRFHFNPHTPEKSELSADIQKVIGVSKKLTLFRESQIPVHESREIIIRDDKVCAVFN